MKSITIHNLEDDIYTFIRAEAKKNRRSMNQEIKDKLINLFVNKTNEKEELSFKKYLGLWSEKEYVEFRENTADFEKISERDWL